MRRVLFLLLILLLPVIASAASDRAGLIKAWEADMRRDDKLDALPDGSYHFKSESLGYDGSVRLLAAIVREDAGMGRNGSGMRASGSVDFDLTDLSPEQRASNVVGIWKAGRQNFVFDGEKNAWLSIAAWVKAQNRSSSFGEGFSSAGFVLDAALLGFLLFLLLVFWLVLRQQRRSRSLLDESSALNRMGRENIERTGELRETQAATMRESLELARHNAQTLDAILAELRRRPD